MRYSYFLVLILLSFNGISAQATPTGEKYATSFSDFRRIIVAPFMYPYVPINNDLVNRDGSTAYRLNSTGFDLGLRVERYSPMDRISFGVDLGGTHRTSNWIASGTSPLERDYSSSYDEFLVTPFVVIRNAKFEKIRKPVFRLGLSGRASFNYTIRTTESIPGGVPFKRILVNPAFTDNYALYAFLGAGFTKRSMPFGRLSNRITNISIGAYVPVFNQAERFSPNPALYPDTYRDLTGLRQKEFYFGIQANQFLDQAKTIQKISYDNKEALSKKYKKESVLLPPLVNYTKPYKKVEGVLNLGMMIQPRIDSINIGEDTLNFAQLQPSSNWSLGYSFHFLGTHSKRYPKSDDGDLLERPRSREGGDPPPAITFNLFAGGRITRQFQRIETETAYLDLESWLLAGEGGLRFGHPVVFAHIGGGYQIRFGDNLRGESSVGGEFSFSQPSNNLYYFAGVQLFDLLFFRVQYVDTFTSSKVNPVAKDQLSFLVGFGF